MNRQEEEQLIRLTKLMLIVVMVLIILTFVQCEKEAKAGIITGEKALGGASYWIDKYIEATGHSVYTESIDLLAEVMFHENYVNGEEVMYYTGAVVMNRVKHKDWPNTVKKVLYQKGQYSTVKKFYTKEIPESVYHLACRVARGTPDVPETVLSQAMFKQGKIWKAIPSSYSSKDVEYFCYGR